MHMDTSLGQGVFHGWSPLPLQSPKKQKKITNRILTAAQRIPGGQDLLRICVCRVFGEDFLVRIF